MARKPTLSPSKITLFLACKVKYLWTYVDHRGKWYLRAKSYYSFGTTLHRVLERFHDSGDIGVTTAEEAVAALEESWIDAGFSSAEEMAEAYGEGKEIVERYVEEKRVRPSEAKTLFVERQLKLDMGEFVLVGRVDRVDEYPDGILEIVDYKSGREHVTEDEVRYDVAMSCYQLMLKRRYPEKPVRATVVALRSGETASASLTHEELDEFEADIKRVGMQILTEEYYDLIPAYRPLCRTCDFIPLCRKDPDFGE